MTLMQVQRYLTNFQNKVDVTLQRIEEGVEDGTN
jgi:hypothetical protein